MYFSEGETYADGEWSDTYGTDSDYLSYELVVVTVENDTRTEVLTYSGAAESGNASCSLSYIVNNLTYTYSHTFQISVQGKVEIINVHWKVEGVAVSIRFVLVVE